MKKVVLFTALNVFVITGCLLTSCDNTSENKEEYAEEQADAIDDTNEARAELRSADDMDDLSEVRDDLSETAQELEAAKKEYITELQNRQKTLGEKISDLDTKVTDPNQANREKWVERRKELTRQRDRVRADLLELQNPMDSDQFTTVKKEIDELMSAIDKSLAEN